MLVPAVPPQPAAVGRFDYVTVDAQRRRVYAAHTGAQTLLVADADSGKVLGQVRVGPMRGVAVDPANGHVFTGDGDANAVSEVDPVAFRVIRTTPVPGHVDALVADPARHRLYAAEDDGTRLFVLDMQTLALIATVSLPGHKPEYLAVDPATHDVYQNIDDLAEVAVIDPHRLAVTRTFATPQLTHNHPLQYDPAYHILIVGGNGVVASYRVTGDALDRVATGRFDQCDLDGVAHVVVCAGDGGITRIAFSPDGTLRVLDTTAVAPGLHTLAVDPVTHAVFAVWSAAGSGRAFLQRFVPAGGP